jgi:hypothetical protein
MKLNGFTINIGTRRFCGDGQVAATNTHLLHSIKYVLHPGEVKANGKTYYVTGLELAKRYGVDFDECAISHPSMPPLPESTKGLPHLYPQANGDYNLANIMKRHKKLDKHLE